MTEGLTILSVKYTKDQEKYYCEIKIFWTIKIYFHMYQ